MEHEEARNQKLMLLLLSDLGHSIVVASLKSSISIHHFRQRAKKHASNPDNSDSTRAVSICCEMIATRRFTGTAGLVLVCKPSWVG